MVWTQSTSVVDISSKIENSILKPQYYQNNSTFEIHDKHIGCALQVLFIWIGDVAYIWTLLLMVAKRKATINWMSFILYKQKIFV